MAARAAFVFIFLAIGVIQLLRFSASPQTPQYYAVGFAPQMTSQPRHIPPYMMAPQIKTLHNIQVEEATKSQVLRYLELDNSDRQKVQRTVLLSLFRISKAKPTGHRRESPTLDEVLADPSGEAATLAAAYEVFFIARDLFGGPVQDYVDTCLKQVMLTTKDMDTRVEILDSCFRAFPAEYKDTPVEDGLRLFRMLLAPQTADLAFAKTDVRTFTDKLNKDTVRSVEKWMRDIEAGKMEFLGPSDFAEDCLTVNWDPMDLLMPFMPRKKHARAQSPTECFLFEESLRNYKTVVMDLRGFDL
jgi:hypothetical protein